jgi:hypothetical protein
MPPGTQIDKTTCFPFRKAGGFLCLLRLLPQAPYGHELSRVTQKILWLRDCRSLSLDQKSIAARLGGDSLFVCGFWVQSSSSSYWSSKYTITAYNTDADVIQDAYDDGFCVAN